MLAECGRSQPSARGSWQVHHETPPAVDGVSSHANLNRPCAPRSSHEATSHVSVVRSSPAPQLFALTHLRRSFWHEGSLPPPSFVPGCVASTTLPTGHLQNSGRLTSQPQSSRVITRPATASALAGEHPGQRQLACLRCYHDVAQVQREAIVAHSPGEPLPHEKPTQSVVNVEKT